MAGAVAPLRIVSIAESGPGSLTHTGRSRELGTPVMLFEAGPRILSTGDEDISRVMAACFRAAGMDVRERFGPVHRFDKTPVILGCHIVGERAVELARVAAVAIAAEMTVEQLARIPLSPPTPTF